MTNAELIFIFIAVLHSLFLGIYAEIIFSDSRRDKWNDALTKLKPKRIYQIVLNLSGAAIGWIAFYYLLFIRIDLSKGLGWTDLVVVLIGLLGITGFLPKTLFNDLPAAFKKVIK